MVVIAPHTGSSPKSVIDSAIQAEEERQTKSKAGLEDEYGEIWVVFDTEGPQNVQRQNEARNAIDRSNQLGFRTAISNPSFEYWILLHFEWFVGLIKDGRAACKLVKKYIPEYGKSFNVFDRTWTNVQTAIQRSKRVFTERYQNCSNHPCDCHPCTEVHELVESLISEV